MFRVLTVVGTVSALDCDVAVVGGGAGGLYTTYRLAAAAGRPGGVPALGRVCLLERSSVRVGGRVHTLRGLGPHGDLTAELGAYRFAQRMTQDNQDTTCI